MFFSVNIDCSQPLKFSTHTKEKASKVNVKHAGFGGGGGVGGGE